MAKSKKKVVGVIKLQIEGGKATPAPPVGPALSQHKVNISDFVQKFNDRTRDRMGLRLPVEITVFEDKSYDFVVRQPPMAVLLKMKAGLQSGSKNAKQMVAKLTVAQVKEVATQKIVDMNTTNVDAATRTAIGACRSMGIEVVEG